MNNSDSEFMDFEEFMETIKKRENVDWKAPRDYKSVNFAAEASFSSEKI